MNLSLNSRLAVLALSVLAINPLALQAKDVPKAPPDLTKDPGAVDRKATYNLGSTGLRGWIHTKPATHLDSLQGRTTDSSRQILVTHVGAKSPADGVVRVDDVIVGVAGKPFSDDARKSIALAIQDAEKETAKGLLKLSIVRAGQPLEIELRLAVLGTYSATAPWNCAKSKRVFEDACKVLEKEPLREDWAGAVNGLSLLSTGNPDYLPRLQEFARKLAPADLDLGKKKGATWDQAYRNLFLCEYYLVTGDREVLHGIREYTLSMARGQSMYGTYGHGFAARTEDGGSHGSIPPYGPVNMAGLPANLSIVLARKCGIQDPEVDQAIARAAGFFGYFTDKGAIPYGEHEPWPFHENNGKNSIAALMFSAIGGKPVETRFFARMAVAGFCSRECGHTGQGFSYLWSALGANVGGPAAASAFFREASWHLDLVRRCDGSFTYDGAEQYGPGKTDDDTYYGKSGYHGLSPNATYVLTYSMPLRKLVITGREFDPKDWLDRDQVAASIAAGRFDLECRRMSATELVEAFSAWSPVVRSWAAEELATRKECAELAPKLIELAAGTDVHVIQGACETLGLIKSVEALPVLVRQLSHPDRWVRYKAAQAIKGMGAAARPALDDILRALVSTAEPMSPINWADPVQIAHGQLAAAVFSGPLKESLKGADPRLLYPAVRVVSQNPDGMARATLKEFFDRRINAEDVITLAPDILAAVRNPCPADTMFGNEIRMGGFKALTKYRFKEGIEAGVHFARTQGGHGSEKRTGEIMKEIAAYGAAAKPVIPQLRELIVMFNDQVKQQAFPGGELNQRRVGAVEEAIRSIEAATTQPELRSIPMR